MFKIQNFKIHNFKISKFQNLKFHNFEIQICIFSNYTARLQFWSTKQTWSCDKNNSIWKIRGNPLPESCVGLFTTLCTGRILTKHNIKIVFLQHRQKSKIEIFFPINSPPNSRSTAPLRRLFMLRSPTGKRGTPFSKQQKTKSYDTHNFT